ncbi:MAG: hypothetical protein ABSB29_00340 [Nitrososphaerales archaeon]
MRVNGRNGRLVNVLLVALIIAGAGLVYYVIQVNAATPATITPNLSEVGLGQTASITVSWSAQGQSVPYTVYLYQGPTSSSCGTSFPLVAAKTGLPTPGYTFNVNPTATSYYCGTVQAAKGSSAVSAIVTVTVNPALVAPTLSLSTSGIDSGQTVVITSSVAWSGGIAPFTVTMYRGANSTCALDTTKATLVSGPNPQVGLTGRSTTFSVADPPSTTYYCASVTDSATNPHTLTSPAVPFVIDGVLSASIAPKNPTVDAGQSITLTAVPTYGTPPYSYRWFKGAGCSSQEAISGATGSVFQTGPIGSSFNYSLLVSDSSIGTPAQSACADDVGTINSAFAGTVVKVSPANVTTDAGIPVTLTVAWQPNGTPPYIVILTTSNKSDCQSPVSFGIPRLGVARAITTFNVNASSLSFFCATVVDDATVPQNASSTFAATVDVNPALSPSLAFSPSALDLGQSASVTATLTFAGGTPPYSAKLTSGNSGTCAMDATLVAVSSGHNPQSGVVGASTTFKFNSQASSTDYCAAVSDATGVVVSTTVVALPVNALLTATVTPPSPAIDSGQFVVLTANTLKGSTPYTYQWYTGLQCASGDAITGKTSATYTTPSLTSSMNYSVLVGDSSGGTPVYAVCVNAAVTVNPTLGAPVLVLSPASINSGQPTTVTASISWSGGSPQYTVTLYSGASTKCSSDTTVVPSPKTGLTTRSATFSFSAPTSSLYYCASVKDGSVTPVSATSSTTQFTVNTALAAPSLVISPTSMNAGQTVTVNATVTWSGGSSPYTVTLYSGSSATCSSDTSVVALLSGTNPQKGLTGTSASFMFTAPSSTTYYCAKLTDSSGTPVTLSTSTVSFTVRPSFDKLLLVVTPTALDSGQSVPLGVIGKVTWSGGAPPYTVTLYSGSSATCSSDITIVGVLSASNPQTGLAGTSATFTFTAPGTSIYYCATVQESSVLPITLSSGTTYFVVNPALTVTISPAAPSTGSGQPITLTALPLQGTLPYTYQWYTGPTCGNPATSGAAVSGANKPSYAPKPTSITTYSVKVIDSSGGVPAGIVCTQVTVVIGISNTVSPSAPSIDGGQSINLTALASSGIGPYTYQWYTGSTCSIAISGATKSNYTASPTSTTQYSVMATDSTTPAPNTACSAATVTVNPSLTGTTITVSPSAVLDSGQSVALVVSWPNAGTPLYTVQLTTSPSASCSSPVAFESQTGIVGTSVTFTISPASSAHYCATVTDSAYLPENSSTTAAAVVSVKPALSTPTLVLSPSAIDKGQTATITATVVWSGGTSPYTVTLYSGSSPSCTFDTTKVAVSGSNPKSGLTGMSTTFSFASPVSTTFYCAIVTDSATTQVSESSSSSVFTVNTALAATISPASPTIDTGQSVVLTAAPSGGTPTYSYQWYSSSTCTSAIPGQTSQSYSTSALTSTHSFSTLVTDSSPGIPGASYCASVTVTVNAAIGATITPASPKIDSGQVITLTAAPSGGAPSYRYQWYSGSGCVGINALSGATSSSFFTGTLTTSTAFSVKVNDSSVGIPAASFCASVTVTVNSVLTAGAITPSAPTIDSGRSITLTSIPSGGTTPYAYQWYTGAGCTAAVSGATSATYTPSPTTTTTYYYKVTDSSSVGAQSACSSGDTVTVDPALVAGAITPSAPKIDNGQSITLTSHASGGTGSYTYQWYTGSSATCSSDTTKLGTVSTQSVSPTSSTYYCYSVTDTSTNAPTVSSATDLVTVNAALVAGAITPSAPTIDNGQSITLTSHASGGTGSYTYQWYTGASCSSGSISGATSATYMASPSSDTTYYYKVTDSASTPSTACSAGNKVTVNPTLTAPVISALPTSVSKSGSSTLSTATSFSGGTSTYTCQWLEEAPGATVYSNLGSSFACTTSSLPTVSTGALATAGTYKFELKVTDSSAVLNAVFSGAVTVIVS